MAVAGIAGVLMFMTHLLRRIGLGPWTQFPVQRSSADKRRQPCERRDITRSLRRMRCSQACAPGSKGRWLPCHESFLTLPEDDEMVRAPLRSFWPVRRLSCPQHLRRRGERSLRHVNDEEADGRRRGGQRQRETSRRRLCPQERPIAEAIIGPLFPLAALGWFLRSPVRQMPKVQLSGRRRQPRARLERADQRRLDLVYERRRRHPLRLVHSVPKGPPRRAD